MIESLVDQIESRFAEVGRLITDADVIGDRNRYAEVGREYRRLEPAAKLAEEWRHATDDAAGAREALAESGGPQVPPLLRAPPAGHDELPEAVSRALGAAAPPHAQEDA